MSLKSIVDGVKKSFGEQRSILSIPELRLDLEEHRILIVYLFAGMGDAILLAPILQSIYRVHPEASIGLLLRPLAARTLQRLNLPIKIHLISEALLENAPTRSGRRKRALVDEERKLKTQIKNRAYTVAVDLTAKEELDSLHWLAAADVDYRIGWVKNPFDIKEGRLDWGVADARLMADRHWTQVNLLPFSCFNSIALEPSDSPGWKLGKSTASKAQARWKKGKRILLVPGSRSEVKRWSPRAFTELATEISERFECSIIVSGGPNERDFVTDLAKSISGGASAYTGKDLSVLIALIQSADLVVTNDTGPMHFSFLNEIPTIAFFTYMNPLVWGPRNPNAIFRVFDIRSQATDEQFLLKVKEAALILLADFAP